MFLIFIDIKKKSKTKYIAEELSKICNKGDVLTLSGEIGAGKTTFIRYFIKKMSNTSNVPSPTYNLMLPYESSKSIIYHMDAWRIKNYKEIISLGVSEMFENSIFLIEWAEKISKVLPKNCLRLHIENKDDTRVLRLDGNSAWKKRLQKFIDNENK